MTKGRAYKCAQCLQVYEKRVAIRHFVLEHLDNTLVPLYCALCNLKLPTENSLNRHGRGEGHAKKAKEQKLSTAEAVKYLETREEYEPTIGKEGQPGVDLFKLSQEKSAEYWATLDQSYLFGSPLLLDSPVIPNVTVPVRVEYIT